MINNLLQFHAAMAALAPIDGVAADGAIFFHASATAAQIAAANAAAATYTDATPKIIGIEILLGRLTDAEYTAVVNLAGTNVALHRAIFDARKVDLSLPAVQTLIQAIATAAGMTPARQAAVTAALPAIPNQQAAPAPPMVNVFGPPSAG